jgi:hypothetical protein
MEDFEQKIIAEMLGEQFLVTRCVIRALVRQPNFDAKAFIDSLAKEEGAMTDEASGAKNMIKSIIAEVEGYA